jgi:AraC-like DNA-binding protein
MAWRTPAHLLIDEILIRLLGSRIEGPVVEIGHAESSAARVAEAVEWMRTNFAQPMNIADLAELVHMRVSSFHQHCQAVALMSPLQFQKVLRLQEARRLMIVPMMVVGRRAGRWGISACRRSVENTTASSGMRQAGTSPGGGNKALQPPPLLSKRIRHMAPCVRITDLSRTPASVSRATSL